MSEINVATVCDKNYLVRALTLYYSVRRKMPDAKFWFLSMDEESKYIIEKLNLNNFIVKTVYEINDAELLNIKDTRTSGEFAMSSKASWLLYIFNSSKVNNGDSVFFIDADILIFSSLQNLIDKMKKENYSIGITPHKFPPKKISISKKVGIYNSGFEAFIVNNNSRACLEDWRKLCIEWCYLKEDNNRLGDQKYLEDWPKKFSGVYEIPDKGINTGSWNISNWKISERNGAFFIDEDPLLCYHFHRIKFYIRNSKVKPLPIYIYHKELYGIYTEYLEWSLKEVWKIDKNWKYGFVGVPNTLKLIKQKITRIIMNLRYNG